MSTDEAVASEIARRIDQLRVDLDRIRVDYAEILVHLSKLSTTETEPKKRRAMELLATVVSTDYEMKLLLFKALAEPEDREVWEKYLVLAIQTAVDELPRRVGSDHRDAGRDFKEALKPMKSDVVFMHDLGVIRDRVAAHHDLTNGDHWQAQWHLAAIANKRAGHSVLRSSVVVHASTVLAALDELGRALIQEDRGLLPPRPRHSADNHG
ncbi:hypothetical protein F0U44_20270 [Nocardioides humilatus]|uniref:HEPN AbiU2-like domain-containing protein n=1 Tax=Nocardioides humilatus TaxID=2607660 RepID=A0A5B1L6A9_9ACTN|nr:hypothetical protein [Nocardioides humilatus]KAA1415966.1 hypothetical protein F0U44_20270 [Nocardioides humilatus]